MTAFEIIKNKIEFCLENKYVPVIVGPTAAGKTALSFQIADFFPVEIISCDSRQIYIGLDIGTAKPDKNILSAIPHHLISIIPPEQSFSSFDFAESASVLISEIFNRGRLPLLVGGTGLYIKTLFDGMFDAPERDLELRAELEKKMNFELFDFLVSNDPETAAAIHINDKKRLVRAVEVLKLTGKKMSLLKKENTKPLTNFKPKYFYVTANREIIYEKINMRVDEMLKNGWIEETKILIESGFSSDIPAFEGLGYREIIDFLKGKIKFTEMRDSIKMFTRRYAKRQLIWFNHQLRDPFIIQS